MDVTYYKTIDNIQYYIYTIVDNFSRKIIAYDVSKKLSASIRLKSLKRAIKKEFKITVGNPNIDLIVDGGSENNNQTIHEFIKNQQVQITKKIALLCILVFPRQTNIIFFNKPRSGFLCE